MKRKLNLDLKRKFESYPENIRPKMTYLRNLILAVAASDKTIGELEETLKWGEPAYLTTASKSGTTIRIDWKANHPDQIALYVNCKTTLIDTYKSLFPHLTFQGNRAVIFSIQHPMPEDEIRVCIRMALKYHLEKKQSR